VATVIALTLLPLVVTRAADTVLAPFGGRSPEVNATAIESLS